MKRRPTITLSHVIAAPHDAAERVAINDVPTQLSCDCSGISTFELLVELGTLPERVATIEGTQPVVVWRLSIDQLHYLVNRDVNTPLVRPDNWVEADLIVLPRENAEDEVRPHRQVSKLASKALARDETVFARVQYVGSADIQ